VVVQDEKGTVLQNGIWTGNIKIIAPFNELRLVGRYGSLISSSNSFNVTALNATSNGSIGGAVVERGTKFPISSAQVDLLKAGQITHTITTGADGWYHFLGLASGEYTIRVTKSGFAAVEESITIYPGCQSHDVELGVIKKPLLIVPGILGSTQQPFQGAK
jgi:hypothetical protein